MDDTDDTDDMDDTDDTPDGHGLGWSAVAYHPCVYERAFTFLLKPKAKTHLPGIQ